MSHAVPGAYEEYATDGAAPASGLSRAVVPLLLLAFMLLLATPGCAQSARSESERARNGQTGIERDRPPDGYTTQQSLEQTVSREADSASFSGAKGAYVPEWELDSIGGEPPVPRLDGSISFMYDEMNGNFACRTYYLLYGNGINGSEMTIGRKMFHNTYGCGEREGTAGQEATFAGALADVESIRVERGRRLTLTGADGTVLVFSPPEPPPTDPRLEDSEWLLVSLLGEPPVSGTRPDMTVGRYVVSLDTGCNGFGAEFARFEGGRLALSKEPEGEMMGTAMGCPNEIGRQERRYLDTFMEVSAYRFSEDGLELTDGSGEVLLVYRRGG